MIPPECCGDAAFRRRRPGRRLVGGGRETSHDQPRPRFYPTLEPWGSPFMQTLAVSPCYVFPGLALFIVATEMDLLMKLERHLADQSEYLTGELAFNS